MSALVANCHLRHGHLQMLDQDVQHGQLQCVCMVCFWE